ncbi:MAG TPA: hypothetical protein VJB14_02645 [Planctomycetota bacterium]|nr:hypothetical protein [Planctomycetota bacterium]
MRPLLIVIASLLTACESATYLRRAAECPEGYVPVDTARGEFRGRAISAAGVVLAIRERSNEQEASLDFWAEVVRKELTETQGYAVRASKEINGGRAILFAAPNEKTTSYYISLFVTPSKIVSVEVAGPREQVDLDLPRLEEYISKLRLQ